MVSENLKDSELWSNNEISKLIHAKDKDYNNTNKIEKRDILQGKIIILLGCHGLSLEEIINLKFNDIKFYNGIINISNRKINNVVEIKFPLDLVLKEYYLIIKFELDKNNNYFLINNSIKKSNISLIKSILKSFKKRAGIDKYLSINYLNKSDYIQNSNTIFKDEREHHDDVINELSENKNFTFIKMKNELDIFIEYQQEINEKINNNIKKLQELNKETSLKENVNEMNILQEEVDESKNLIKKLIEENKTLKQEINLLKESDKNLNLNQKIDLLTKENNKLIEEVDSLKQKHKRNNIEIKKLQNNLVDLEKNQKSNQNLNKHDLIFEWIQKNIKITNSSKNVIEYQNVVSSIFRLLNLNNITVDKKELNSIVNLGFKKYYISNFENKTEQEYIKTMNGRTFYLGFKFKNADNSESYKEYKKLLQTTSVLIDKWINEHIQITIDYDNVIFHSILCEEIESYLNMNQVSVKRKNLEMEVNKKMNELYIKSDLNKIKPFKPSKRIGGTDKQYHGFIIC